MLRFQICPLVLLVVCGSLSESLIPLSLHSVQVVYPDQEPRGTPPSQAKKLTTEYSPVDSPLQIVRSSCELKANGIHKILSASLFVKGPKHHPKWTLAYHRQSVIPNLS